MHQGLKETAADNELIEDEEADAHHGEEVRPSFGEQHLPAAGQNISTKKQGCGYDRDRGSVQAPSGRKRAKTGKDQQIERDVEVSPDCRRQSKVLVLGSSGHE